MGSETAGQGMPISEGMKDFAAIVPLHAAAMMRVAAAFVGPAEAEDAAQEAERKGGCRRRSPTSLPRSIRPLPHSQQPPRSAGTVQASEDMRSRTTIRRQTKKVAVLKIRQTI